MQDFFKKIKYNSPVVLTFTFISMFVLLLSYLTKGYSTSLLFTNMKGSLVNPLTYLRQFTHILGHSNFQHLFGNFTLILIIGPLIEEKYGSKKLLIMILVTALITGLINCLFFKTGLLGASGIVFMLILLSSISNTRSGEIPLTLVLIFIIFIGKELYTGIVVNDSISQMAHVIGGLTGGFFGYYFLKSK